MCYRYFKAFFDAEDAWRDILEVHLEVLQLEKTLKGEKVGMRGKAFFVSFRKITKEVRFNLIL